MLNVSEEACLVIERLQDSGYEAYVVGGAVRDLLLGITPKDFDIATNARAEDVVNLFTRTFLTGEKFGVITVLIDRTRIEVATFRVDGPYYDSRRPDNITLVGDLESDLSRRDFTINAMAYDINTESVIDPFGGQDDLLGKKLVAVGDPVSRMVEDPLRMMRGVRLCCQLDLNLNTDLFFSIVGYHSLLNYVSKERIKEELVKILLSRAPHRGLTKLKCLGLLEVISPRLSLLSTIFPKHPHSKNVLQHTADVLQNLSHTDDAILMLAGLFHDVGKINSLMKDDKLDFSDHCEVGEQMVVQELSRLRFSKKTIYKVSKLVKYHSLNTEMGKKGLRNLINIFEHDYVMIERLFRLRRADLLSIDREIAKPLLVQLNRLSQLLDEIRDEPDFKKLAINGYDVMNLLDIPGGKKVGDILDYAYQSVLDNRVKNDRQDLLEFVKNYKDDKKIRIEENK